MTEPKGDLAGKTADQVAATIRDNIRSGVLPAGAQVPSIRDLVKRGAGRGVSERALDMLRAEGLIEKRHGTGTFVKGPFARIPRISPSRLAAAQWGAGQAIQDHDTAPRPRTVDVVVGDVVPPPDVAAALGVADGVKVLCRSRRFVVDSRPVQTARSYLPTELTRGTQIEHTDTGPGGLYARLAEQGWAPTRFRERVVSRAPQPEEVEALNLRRTGAIVFEVTRLAWSGERCVEVNRMVLDVEAYELVYDFPAGSPA